jgi:hypothetical protein
VDPAIYQTRIRSEIIDIDLPAGMEKFLQGTHLRRDTVIPPWFQASKAAAASDRHAVHC